MQLAEHPGVTGRRIGDPDESRPIFDSFRDLQAMGVVANWMTLKRLIANEGFPPGRLISPQRRAWERYGPEGWMTWLRNRPTVSETNRTRSGKKAA
jgi:hypothetical protein